VGDGAATLVARVFEARGVPPPADALSRFLALYDERLLEHTRPYAGVPGILDLVSARARLALLTNKPLAATRRIVDGLQLGRYFPATVTIGGDGRFPRKPDPAGLEYLTATAAVPAERTLLVGDSVIDWRTARAAATGMCVARYGFGFEGFPIDELGPRDYVIDSPAALLAL
jgi:phosphoglycolate phosphatase